MIEPKDPITNSLGIVTEKTIVQLRPHAGKLVWSALAFIALTFGLAFGIGMLDQPWMRISVAVAWVVLVVGLVLYPWVRWLSSGIVITTHRVIMVRGLIHRERREVLLVRVNDVTVKRAPGQLMSGSGDVLLGVGAEQAVRIPGVPRPNLVAAALSELVYAQNPRA